MEALIMSDKYQHVVLAVFVGIFIQLWALAAFAITRDEVIANAERYATHKWRVLPGNAHSKFNKLKTGQVVTGLPYNWGGFDTIERFDRKIRKGIVAGDSKIFGKARGEFAGIDCSGFISRVWGIGRHTTRSLHNDKKYPRVDWKDLKPGDILNDAGSHVRLFHRFTNDNRLNVYESTTSVNPRGVTHRVISRNNAKIGKKGRYIPRRYKKIKEASISTPIQTPSIYVSTTAVVTEVRPNRLKALPSGKRQWIKIYGKNFTPHSKLEFRMVGVTKFPNRVPIFISSKELRYKINVGSNANDWTVKIINGKKRSKSYAFKVVTGTLVPPGQYPEASTRYLKSADLIGKSAWELKLMRNGIFARHGYIFKTPKIRDYFNKQSWYEPKFRNVDNKLTDIERANIKFIRQRETSIAIQSGDKSDKYPIVIIAWLSEIGYVNPFEASNHQKVRSALKAFQRDSRLPQTGKLDDKVWEKLSLIRLNSKTKVQLHSLINSKWIDSTALKSCDPDLIWVAASLAEMGYFTKKLERINVKNVQAALKAFQRDIGVLQTGQLDKTTWERISAIKSSTKMRNQINVLRCR
jgi:hypothetical protein